MSSAYGQAAAGRARWSQGRGDGGGSGPGAGSPAAALRLAWSGLRSSRPSRGAAANPRLAAHGAARPTVAVAPLPIGAAAAALASLARSQHETARARRRASRTRPAIGHAARGLRHSAGCGPVPPAMAAAHEPPGAPPPLLSFQRCMVEELLEEDGLTVMAAGLGLREVAGALLRLQVGGSVDGAGAAWRNPGQRRRVRLPFLPSSSAAAPRASAAPPWSSAPTTGSATSC
jgi:hypothetical protein